MKPTQSNLLERAVEVLDDMLRYHNCRHLDTGGYNDCCYCEAKRLRDEVSVRRKVAA